MKLELLAAAAAGIALGLGASVSDAEAAPKKKNKKKVECFGINSCSGKGACVVTEKQIAEAKKAFPGKYTKSVTTECKGNNKCGAPSHLAWVLKPSAKDCFKAQDNGKKGFIYENGKIRKS